MTDNKQWGIKHVFDTDSLFRDLDQKEIAEFRQWARENHKAGDQVSPLWHPVVRNECYTMDKEAGLYKEEN